MSNNKLYFVIGFLTLLAGVMLGCVCMMNLSGLASTSGEVVGNATLDDGTSVTQVEIKVDEKFYVVNMPEGSDGSQVYYNRKDPSKYVNRSRTIRELLMFALPMMVLGVTLMASNRKALSDITGIKDDEDKDDE